MSTCVVLVEILKNLYGNPRPFWKDTDIFIVCEGGFGNPSGHSIASASIFLALWSTIFDKKNKKGVKKNYNSNYQIMEDNQVQDQNENEKKNLLIKYTCLIFSILMIFLILFSRLYLAAHSLNQVIYGASLGFSIYFIYYKILELHLMEIGEFYDYFLTKIKICTNYLVLGLFFSIGLIVYFLKENETKPYEELLNTKCPKLKPYKKFNENGLYGGMVIFIFTGCYTGIIILLRTLINTDDFKYELYYKNEKNVRLLRKLYAINSWNNVDFINKFWILLIFILCCLPILLNLIVPSDSKLWIIFIFKTAVPFFIMGLNGFGLTIYFVFKFNITNFEYDLENDEDYENNDFENDNNSDSKSKPLIMDDLEYRKVEIKK